MFSISQAVNDLMKKKSSQKLKYEIDWESHTISPANSMAFSSPVHDPVSPSATSTKAQALPSELKLERGSIDLPENEAKNVFKKQDPALKRFSNAVRGRFPMDFLRSKSSQKLHNTDDHEIDYSEVYLDCKQTSSISKIKKQARVIDVHVQQLNTAKSNTDGKVLLKHDDLESEIRIFSNGKNEPRFENFLVNLEAATKLRRHQIAYIILFLATVFFVPLDRFVLAVCGLAFPLYFSVKILKSESNIDPLEYKKWLTYWSVFAFISCFDGIFLASFSYNVIKTVILVYLYLPWTNGSLTLFELVVQPTVLFLEENIRLIYAYHKVQ
uniref:Receptor expression-enhancing protein n=1 Tax=Panagrolaimus sp. JU765 TaxID=591449 RepID=A0AC34RIW5_9BILA